MHNIIYIFKLWRPSRASYRRKKGKEEAGIQVGRDTRWNVLEKGQNQKPSPNCTFKGRVKSFLRERNAHFVDPKHLRRLIRDADYWLTGILGDQWWCRVSTGSSSDCKEQCSVCMCWIFLYPQIQKVYCCLKPQLNTRRDWGCGVKHRRQQQNSQYKRKIVRFKLLHWQTCRNPSDPDREPLPHQVGVSRSHKWGMRIHLERIAVITLILQPVKSA